MYVRLIFLLLLISAHTIQAQIDLQAVYDDAVKSEHGKKAWTDAESLAEQRERIADYEKNPLEYLGRKAILPAIAYGYCGKPEKAVGLFETYLTDDPDNGKINHLLGITQLSLGGTVGAITHLQKAWSQGFDLSPKYLALAYLNAKDYSACEKLIPDLLKHRDEPQTRDFLAGFSLATTPIQTNLFLQASEGLTDGEILKRHDGDVSVYLHGLWLANQEERARQIVATALHTNHDLINMLLINSIWTKMMVDNYEKQPGLWKSNELIIAAISYASEQQYAKARACYLEYLSVEPDQPRALRGLAATYLFQGDYEKAGPIYKKAWGFGDLMSLKGYADTCEKTKRYDKLNQIMPDLLKHKGEDIELIIPITDYAMSVTPHDKKLFFEAMEGVSDQEILTHPNITDVVILALKDFGDNERARSLQERAARIKTI